MTPKKAYILMLIVLLATIAGSFGVLYVSDKLLAGRASDISRLKAEDQALDTNILTANKNQQTLQELAYVNELAKEVLPPEKIQSNLLGEVLANAEDAGIFLSSIAFSGSIDEKNPQLSQTVELKDVPGVRALQFTVDMSSISYSQLLDFLENLEKNRRKMQVESLTITPELEDDQQSDKVSANITVNVYIKP